MIILEGPDNAGKTTLGEALSKSLGVPLKHSVRPANDATEQDLIEHAVFQLEPHKSIMDRCYLVSELVYGTILRGNPGLGRDQHLKLMNDMLELDHIMLVYCRPSADTILDNGKREQMEGVIKYHPQIITNYDRVMVRLSQLKGKKFIRYDYHTDDLAALIEICMNHLNLTYSEITNYES